MCKINILLNNLFLYIIISLILFGVDLDQTHTLFKQLGDIRH